MTMQRKVMMRVRSDTYERLMIRAEAYATTPAQIARTLMHLQRDYDREFRFESTPERPHKMLVRMDDRLHARLSRLAELHEATLPEMARAMVARGLERGIDGRLYAQPLDHARRAA